jgi:hypothetical protein
VHVQTLADILDRDKDKIKGLRAEDIKAAKRFSQLEKQAEASIEKQVAALKAKAAKKFGLQQAKKQLVAAATAYHEAIHYDEFEEEVVETLREEHSSNCWPDSDCREAGECTYEPEIEEIEEYLTEHAEDFEFEEGAPEQEETAA